MRFQVSPGPAWVHRAIGLAGVLMVVVFGGNRLSAERPVEAVLHPEADSYIQGNNDAYDRNFGDSNTLNVRYYHTGNLRGNSQHSYLRFDLSDIRGRTLVDARLKLAFAGAAEGDYLFNLFALDYGHRGAEWVEGGGETGVTEDNGYVEASPPSPVTWRLAPGNAQALGGGDPEDTNGSAAPGVNLGETTWLGGFSVTVAADEPSAGAWLGLVDGSAALTDFLNQRGDRERITFILTLRENRNREFRFASSRHNELPAPRLVLLTIEDDSGLSRFHRWRATHFSLDEMEDAGLSGVWGNPAGDGMVNLLKYLMGLDPWKPAAREAFPRLDSIEGQFVFRFARSTEATDVASRVEVSENLFEWHSGEEYVEELDVVDEGELERVTVAAGESGDVATDRRFFRLNLQPAAGRFSDAELFRLRAQFETRRDEAFESLRGEPFEEAPKRGPLGPGRPRYTRHYSYSVMDFAMRAFRNGEQLDEANAALHEHSEFYIENPEERDDRDNLHWVTDVMCRIVEFFGAEGSMAPGRLEPETEERIYQLMWDYASANSILEDAQRDTWHVGVWTDPPRPAPTSENHHLMKYSTLWQFSKLLKERPEYRDLAYNDGHTAAEHYEAWTSYAKAYFRERGKRGLFVEFANGRYGAHSLKGIYNFYDFSNDPELKRLAGSILDLYWASWAQEHLDGVRGGGKARIYQTGGDRIGDDYLRPMAAYYLGIGETRSPQRELFTVLTSGYRLPLVVVDLALDLEGRGNCEVLERRPGLIEPGTWGTSGFRMRTDYGGILRYTYATPDFVMGLPVVESRPYQDWAIMSMQNRWMGVIFSGHEDARIVPQCRGGEPHDHRRTDNAQWGVQRKGTLITQRLPDDYTRYTEAMRVWFSDEEHGLWNRVEENGWVFVEAAGAYAAVRAARGGHGWTGSEDRFDHGGWMVPEDDFTPVIIEVARKRDYEDYGAFRDAVMELSPEWEGEGRVMTYTGLYGDTFTFYADHSSLPEVNNRPVDLAPDKVFDSPFIQSDWNSGVVVLTKDGRKRVLDFRK